MPTYEYRCTACEERLEVVQSFSDAPLVKCPNCGKKALRKVFSPVGIVFKGSGFYKTDSRGAKSGSVKKEKDKEKETSSSSASSSSSDTSSSSNGNSSSSGGGSTKKDAKKDSKIA